MMKKISVLCFIFILFLSISGFAQGMMGLVNPKYITPSDNSTSTLLKGLSKERRDLRELPADSGMELLQDLVYHETKSIDGDPMSMLMDLIVFNDDEVRPCVIFITGGGFMMAPKGAHLYDRYELAKAGYVVASVEYHVVSNGIYSDAVKDIKAAIRYLRANAKEYGIDTNNIAVWGESAGGYMTAMVGATNGVEKFEEGENLDQSSDVQAAIDVYGLSDLTQIGADYDEDAANSHFTLDSPDGKYIHGKDSRLTSLDKPEVVAQANPVNYVDENDPPFLLLHGTQDMLVSPSQTLLMHNALREAGVPSTRYVIEGAGHATAEFSDPQVIEIMIDFLDSHLK